MEMNTANRDPEYLKVVNGSMFSICDSSWVPVYVKCIYGTKVIWVALGAPKQERFMNMLLPYLEQGVMIGVGAAFKFYSGTEESRCPEWMQKAHLEFVYRIMQDPKKQLKRCFWIVWTLPGLYLGEVKWARKAKKESGLRHP